MSSSESLGALNLVASARLPSGVNSTCETMSPISTVSMTFTSVPLTDNTLIDLPARLVTRARLPAGLTLRPDGCLPTVTVSPSLGGLAFRPTTQTLLPGPCLNASPSLLTSIESATSAIELVGSIARLTGGPTTEFLSGRLATIFGLSGSATSRITTESFPAGDTIGLPWSSHKSFSSLPTISNGAAWTELKLAIARNVAPLNDESNACFGCMCFPPSLQRHFLPASTYDHRPFCTRGQSRF